MAGDPRIRRRLLRRNDGECERVEDRGIRFRNSGSQRRRAGKSMMLGFEMNENSSGTRVISSKKLLQMPMSPVLFAATA
jgi:hypothetical protein